LKLLLKLLFLFLTWFTNLGNSTPVFAKVALPSYKISFAKIENQKLESEVKIGVENFARSGILENSFFQKRTIWTAHFLLKLPKMFEYSNTVKIR
jgi:hypothetical protein